MITANQSVWNGEVDVIYFVQSTLKNIECAINSSDRFNLFRKMPRIGSWYQHSQFDTSHLINLGRYDPEGTQGPRFAQALKELAIKPRWIIHQEFNF